MRTSIALLAFVAAATAAPFRLFGFGGQDRAEGGVRPSGSFSHPEHTGTGFPHHSGTGFPHHTGGHHHHHTGSDHSHHTGSGHPHHTGSGHPHHTGSFPFPSGTRPEGAPTGIPEGARPWEKRQESTGTVSAPEGRPTDGFPGAGGPPNGSEGGFPGGFPGGASGSFPHPSGTWTRGGSHPTGFPGTDGPGGRPHHQHRPGGGFGRPRPGGEGAEGRPEGHGEDRPHGSHTGFPTDFPGFPTGTRGGSAPTGRPGPPAGKN